MFRRRLFFYWCSLDIGIITAFIIFEKRNILSGCLFIISCMISTYLVIRIFQEDTKTLVVLGNWILAGMVLFTATYMAYQRPVLINGKQVDTSEISEIQGVIVGEEVKKDSVSFICNSGSNIGKIKIRYYKNIEKFSGESHLGKKLNCSGRLRLPKDRDNPMCFDYRLYMKSKGIRFVMKADYIKIEDDKLSNKFSSIYWKYRRYIVQERERYLSNFSEDDGVAGIVRGVVFGDKSEISEDLQEEFNENSTGHILAVSGLHIGFMFVLLRKITSRRRGFLISVFIIVVIFLYGEMTLWNPSTIRSVIVVFTGIISVHIGKRFDLLSALSFSGIIVLIYNPYQLFNCGFQMSYIAMLGISFLAEPLTSIFGKYSASILAVQLAVLPLTAFIFNRLNILSMFINIPIVFITSFMVPICLIGMIVHILMGNIPMIGIKIIEFLTELIINMNSKLAFDGKFSLDICSVNLGFIIVYYIFTFYMSSEFTRIKLLRGESKKFTKSLLFIIMPCILSGFLFFNSFANDEVIFLSVGQGDCTHIRSKSANVLIDGGGNRNFNVGKKILKPYLLKNNAKDIDMAFVTHLHTDHYKGIKELCEVYRVNRVGIPDICEKEMSGISPRYISFSYNIKISNDTKIEAIWPAEDNIINKRNKHKLKQAEISVDKNINENENNMVYLITCKGVKIMVTGDMLEADEIDMLKYYGQSDKIKCDILKVAHHGSKYSTSEEFIEKVSPSVAIIQVGENNIYGHPSTETLEKLKKADIAVYRTDIDGAVGVDIKKGKFKIHTVRTQKQRYELYKIYN